MVVFFSFWVKSGEYRRRSEDRSICIPLSAIAGACARSRCTCWSFAARSRARSLASCAFFSLARLLRRRGSRLLIGQGRLLYADVLSPLVSTSLAIRAIHVVALLAPVRPTIHSILHCAHSWHSIGLGALPIAKGERDTFTAFTIRKRTYFTLSLKSPDLCEACDHAIVTLTSYIRT